MALAAAPEVPGFHALSPLGAGPTSTMYSAHSEQMGRWVALTIYNSADVADGRNVRRFQRAFELARRLGVHPHAVTVLDCGVTPDRRPYLVTEFYEHGTFDSRVSGDQPLPVDKTLRIGISLAGALETAHRADVIHGGVHPARLLADSDDEPSLADTGLVPLVDPSGVNALLGPTNYHSPPEVLEGEPLSPATDVYSLASTLYTLLTARPPYWTSEPEDTSAALLLRILRHEIPPLGRPDVPPSLEQALRAALRSDPRQRPATVVAFAQGLQAVQQEIGAPVTQPVLLDVAAGLRLVRDQHEEPEPEPEGRGPLPAGPKPDRGLPAAPTDRPGPALPLDLSGLTAFAGPGRQPEPLVPRPDAIPDPNGSGQGGPLPDPFGGGPRPDARPEPFGSGPAAPPAGLEGRGGNGLKPAPTPIPRPGPTPPQQAFVPYPVPEPEPDPYFGPLDVPSPHPEPVELTSPDPEQEPVPDPDPGAEPGNGPQPAPSLLPAAFDVRDGGPSPAPGPGPFASAAPSRAPAGAAPVLELEDRPLHERLAANSPWAPQPEAAGPAPTAMATAPPVIPLGPREDQVQELPGAGVGDALAPGEPAVDPSPSLGARVLAPITGPVKVVMKGPRAMPVIVLAVMVAALLAGATWMAITGPSPSQADSPPGESEQQSD